MDYIFGKINLALYPFPLLTHHRHKFFGFLNLTSEMKVCITPKFTFLAGAIMKMN